MKELELPSREIGIMKEMKEMPSLVLSKAGEEMKYGGRKGGRTR